MRRNFFSLGSLLCTLALLLTTAGCRNERPEDFYPDNGRGTEVTPGTLGQQEAEIAIDIPEMMQSTALRSLSKDQEGDASAIRILAFNVPAGVEDGAETYAYEPRIKSGPELRDGKYYVTLQINQTTAPQRLVLLANLPDGKLPAAVTEGATKEAVYESLVYDYAATGWKSDGEKAGATKGTDYDLIPMWGESKAITVAAGANTFGDYYYEDGVIRLYRALARVDVGMKFDTTSTPGESLPETNQGMGAADKRHFDLTDVYVYHPAKSYRLAGNIKNIEKADAKYKAVRPTLPEGVEYYTGKKADELKLHYTVDPDQGRLVRSIYLPEAPVVESGVVKEELDGNPCIVVGGIYKGDNFNPKGKNNTDKTYYRVDFVKAKEEGQDKAARLPILRNHRYRINILDIDGPGHKTTEDAINNTTSDVIYSVSVWDENETSKVVTDGKYWLKLSQDQLKVGKYGGTLPITFETNCPEGWELIVPEKYADDPLNHPERLIDNPLAKPENKEWVKTILNQNTGAVAGRKSTKGNELKPETVDFVIKKQTDPKFQGMEGAFIVQTYGGRLNWTVRIKQTPKLDLVLEIYKDREMTQQINFIEVHEGGWSFDKTITVDGKSYSPKDQGSYTVFYVRALPYGPLSGENKLDGWDLTVTDSGGDDFKFWSYHSFGYSGPDEKKKQRDFDDTDFQSFNSYYKGKGHIPLMFKQVGNNLYELAISNDAMTNPKEPFELRRNKYTFTLTVTDPADPTKKESVSKTFTALQLEHNIVLYTDPDFTKRISYDSKHPEYFMMNGKEKTLYVRSNIPGLVKLLKQGQDERVRGTAPQDPQMIPMEKIVGAKPDYTDLTIDRKTLVKNINEAQDVYHFPANMGRDAAQNKFSFTTRNDITATKKLSWGYGDWVVDTIDPFYKYKFMDEEKHTQGDEFRTEFVCVAVQPEANCYVLELGNYGIFIPLSRINTAADTFYKNWEEPNDFSKYINAGGRGENGWTQAYRSVITTGVTNWTDFMKEENQGLHHLDDDDEVTPEFIWTDYRPYDKTNPGVLYDPKDMSKSKGPIKVMSVIDVQGERYLYVLPGDNNKDNVANTLIAVRSSKHNKLATGIDDVDKPSEGCFEANGLKDHGVKPETKAILWSWHIITVPLDQRSTYLKVNDALKYAVDNNDNLIGEHPGFMYQELGALKRPDRTKYAGVTKGSKDGALIREIETYEVLGMTYQWGRKDPFPTECYDGKEGYENLDFPHLKDANGKPFRTQWLGGSDKSYRFTYKMSIENPTVAVRASAASAAHWLVEAGSETGTGSNLTQQQWQISKLWGGKLLGSQPQREGSSFESTKTVFDPCPYGFKIPSIGFETGMPFSFRGYTQYNAVKALGMNRGRPVTFGPLGVAALNTDRWQGPKSRNGFVDGASSAADYLHLHSADPVYAGNGRTGAWELKLSSPYYSGNSSSLAGETSASKAAVYPILPIFNWREHDYDQYFNPRAKSIGISNNH